jgi:hypothetical protein
MTLTDLLLAINAISPVCAAIGTAHGRNAGPEGYILPVLFGLSFGAIVVIGQYKMLEGALTAMQRVHKSERFMNWVGLPLLSLIGLFPFVSIWVAISVTEACLRRLF